MVHKGSKDGLEEATVRIGPTMDIPAVLKRLGIDPDEVLAEAEFDRRLVDEPDNLISFAARCRLFKHCVDRTGCQHFGLLVGQQAGLNTLGLLGLLVKYSPDAGTALRSLVRYGHLHVRGAVPTLEVHGALATLGFDIYQRQSEAADQVGDGALAVLFNIARSLCGPEWKPVTVQFCHREPADVGPFRRLFLAPLQFDAEHNALVFAATWLDRALPADDPALRRLLQQQIDALDARHGSDLPGQVRSVLRTPLLSRRATADQVAELFSMHSRTLNRRLIPFGTNFRALVDEARFGIAMQMLESSSMEVRQIALALDYAEPSAFTRAFRRWSSTTPAQWRAERTSDGGGVNVPIALNTAATAPANAGRGHP